MYHYDRAIFDIHLLQDGYAIEELKILDCTEHSQNRLKEVLNTVAQNDDNPITIVCQTDKPINNIILLWAVCIDGKMHMQFYLSKSPDDPSKTVENWGCECDFDKCFKIFFDFVKGTFSPNYDEWEFDGNDNFLYLT